MSSLVGQRIWLVGASSGIGAALAEELQRRGAIVAISARRAERLDEVSGGRMVTVPLDVTDRSACWAAAERVRTAIGGIDMVIWCAGYWHTYTATDWQADEFVTHVEVNLLGLNNVIAATLPQMVSHRSGHLVGIASVAGYRGLSGGEAYAATKAAQINLLESMRASLSTKDVQVTTVCPGFVRTDMTETNSFPMPFIIEPEEAATEIADGLEGGKVEIVFPRRMAVTMKVARVLPVRLWAAITARVARSSS
ncbi:MAG: SDR family NAD(P)-dependent oxidoreductase [Janibacter sp.]|jgi:short-subunit dehydrogenase|uniref:SDR family NAD(P)-dependent oxidoreductase n=1 Tax=Janibacter limosus TaxID=53458 RepID=A0A4P6MTZ3_9MICO|nr:SDR family NAD(P)-dependent oxidoreductase [Janibacter limosus]MDN5718113.1 SDR family NAD(P)-dependent oxidoreductase [Janibacter sp.]QBF46282.1 SDR family NAD(P)-dependent oxidoreductase [Janibacter limosus]